MKRIGIICCLTAFTVFGVVAAWGQAAQPVVPVVAGAAVSATNPLPVDATVNVTVTSAAVEGQAASGAALAGDPVRIGLSDGTNAQNWLTGVALGDGVNGNNMGTVVPWYYNGTTWDRVRGDTTNGAWVNVKSSVALTANPTANSFTNITTNTDTNVKASAGTLAGIVVNTGGTGSTAAIYNDADGTCSSGLIATVDTTSRVTLTYNVSATVGICVTTAGAAAADLTLLWR